MIDAGSLLLYSAPVALAALGETVVEKAGIVHIGIEGSMLCGAFFAFLGAHASGSVPVGLVCGIAAGMAMTMLESWFILALAADQIVVGTAANLLALGLTGTIYRARFGLSGQAVTVPRLVGWHGLDAVTAILVVSVPAVWLLLTRTGWGLAARAAGEQPFASEAMGYSPRRLRAQAMVIGGAFVGLAGAYLTLGIAGAFAENMTAGRGFVAIAVVTFGRWRAIWVFGAALLIGLAESFQFQMQASGSRVPFQLLLALPDVVALAVLVVAGKGTAAPEALARPYVRDG